MSIVWSPLMCGRLFGTTAVRAGPVRAHPCANRKDAHAHILDEAREPQRLAYAQMFQANDRRYFVCLTFTVRPISAQSSSVLKPAARIP